MDTQTTVTAPEVIAHPFMVLLVDDQPFVAEVLRRQLTNENDINNAGRNRLSVALPLAA